MLDYFSNIVIPVIILFIIIYGKKQKIDIYESFINGAIEGLKTAWHILPYIIGIFLAIGIFKSGRGIEILEYIFSPMAKLFNIPKELKDITPKQTYLISIKGLKGGHSGIEIRVGIDSLTEQMGATIVGASETIFYTMAIYYGSLKIKDTGYTLFCSLLCHIAGVLASVYICYLIL